VYFGLALLPQGGMGNDGTLDRLMRAIDLAAETSSDFDLNRDAERPSGRILRDASVLVSFVYRDDDWHVVLTKRASVLRHHPGQIAFPGGKMDEGDASVEATALREAHEEIGLHPSSVRLLGALSTHETVTNFNVTPVLGVIEGPFQPQPEAGEVDTVFDVPLSFLMDADRTRIEGRIWNGSLRKYYVIPCGPFYIWGATARMIVGLRHLWDKAG